MRTKSTNFYLVFFFLLFAWHSPIVAAPLPEEAALQKPGVRAEVEIGADEHQRRFFRPHLAFVFPTAEGRVFFDAYYNQRTNSRLRGEVGFWISAGYLHFLEPNVALEAGLYHLSRHISSTDFPRILDANEAMVRAWFLGRGWRFGFGVGANLKGSFDFDHLAVMNICLPGILGSEFSFRGELRFLDLEDIHHEADLSLALNENFDLFVRNERLYGFPITTYLGLRVKSDGAEDVLFEHIRFRGEILPVDETYKLFASQDVVFEILRDIGRRFLLIYQSDIPVFKGNSFLGTFRPEWLSYPFQVQYERRVSAGLYLFGYGCYRIIMPLDREEEFRGSLGFGAGLRNQPNFSLLHKPFRFEIAGGPSFSHSYDFSAAFGLNTTGQCPDIGTELQWRKEPGRTTVNWRLFAEYGSEARLRPFFGMELDTFTGPPRRSFVRFWIGVELIRWYMEED